MKTAAEYVHESLRIDESSAGLQLVIKDPYAGPFIICKEVPTELPHNALVEGFGGYNRGNLAFIQWNKDWAEAFIMDVKDEKGLRKEFDNAITRLMNKRPEGSEVYEVMPCGISIDLPDFVHNVDIMWENWTNQFTKSKVDGDSRNVRYLVDLRKKKVLYGPDNRIDFDF